MDLCENWGSLGSFQKNASWIFMAGGPRSNSPTKQPTAKATAAGWLLEPHGLGCIPLWLSPLRVSDLDCAKSGSCPKSEIPQLAICPFGVCVCNKNKTHPHHIEPAPFWVHSVSGLALVPGRHSLPQLKYLWWLASIPSVKAKSHNQPDIRACQANQRHAPGREGMPAMWGQDISRPCAFAASSPRQG